jgi:hypothetical protein
VEKKGRCIKRINTKRSKILFLYTNYICKIEKLIYFVMKNL